MQRKPSCATTKSTLFIVSKDKWKTKKDTDKSMNFGMYAKSEKIKSTSLAIVELC